MKGADVRAQLSKWDKPRSYLKHPVVKKHEGAKPVVPLAVFLDGVQQATRDSMLVISMTNLLSQKKHILCILRKRLLCGLKASCGCKGWCFLWPVWKFLHWSLQALAEGRWPSARHHGEVDLEKLDGAGWRAEDDHRKSMAGMEMEVAGACMQIRSDWGEMTTRLGVASWSSGEHPCFLCRCTNDTMLEAPLLTQREPLPWVKRTFKGYQNACDSCEILIHPSRMPPHEWTEIKDQLLQDTRAKSGSHGLTLQASFPQHGLQVGDRVEPSQFLMDWASIYVSTPEAVVFWRPSAETSVRHRNPLFDSSLGVTLTAAFTPDLMHTWCLGIQQKFLGAILWHILKSDIFEVQGAGSRKGMEDRANKRMQLLSAHLTTWYANFKKSNPDVLVTRIQDMNLESLGPATKPSLRAKAHENTWSSTLCCL